MEIDENHCQLVKVIQAKQLAQLCVHFFRMSHAIQLCYFELTRD